MLPKKNRVTKALFLSIMKDGGTLIGSVFVFRYIKSNTVNYAVVAPKSVAKKATDRNKLRRKTYMAIRFFAPQTGSGIFFFKKGTTRVTYQNIKDDISYLLKRAKFI